MSLVDFPAVRTGKLAVLVATYNGAEYLNEQLQSVADQRWSSIDVWASDDGSTDTTRSLLAGWADRWGKGRFEIGQGPSRGFAENFRSLLTNTSIEADY